MKFDVKQTPQSELDLAEIVEYIAKDSISSAIKVNDEILERIDSLEKMPGRYPVYEKDPDFHRMVVGASFVVYYRIYEKDHLVKVARIYRSERLVEKIYMPSTESKISRDFSLDQEDEYER